MKKLLIISGKGGTGKTTTAAAFIRFAQAKAFADCDVDAPNLHLITDMASEPTHTDYQGSSKAMIDADACIGCGKCKAACRFDAIRLTEGQYAIDEYACEGCGVCVYVCPQKAVQLHTDIAGSISLYQDERVFSTATLRMGRGNSGKLVAAVKMAMADAAPDAELAIIDGSPGVGCPVIASISGVDLVLLVAEPSVSGFSDLQRIIKTAAIFGTKTLVCINKFDVDMHMASQIEQYCQAESIPFVGRIPFDREVSTAINTSRSIAEVDCSARDALRAVYHETIAYLKGA